MKYDPEYNSYKFSSEEMKNIVDGLTFYSLYSPLDKITNQSVKTLLESINKSTKNSYCPINFSSGIGRTCSVVSS